jgi:translation initiation factor IF-3
LRVNEEIRVREARVIDNDGQQLGILPVREGIRLAAEQRLDLVEVAPQAKPPVCKIMDYGKYKYEQSKKQRDAVQEGHWGSGMMRDIWEELSEQSLAGLTRGHYLRGVL